MRHDDMSSLARVIGCPKCHRTTAFGLFKGEHIRWCSYCNLSYSVFYNKSSKSYKRSGIVKGVKTDDQRYRSRTY